MFIKTFIIVFLSILLGGCFNKSNVDQTFDFGELGFNISKNLLSSMKIEITKNEPLLVMDFVNTKTLKNKSELGFLLSNSIKDSITKKTNFLVKEMEVASEITFGSDGLNALSREIKANQKLYEGRYVLVGTYTLTDNSLIVFTKIVDFTTNDIVASSTQNLPLTKELLKIEAKQRKIHSPLVL